MSRYRTGPELPLDYRDLDVDQKQAYVRTLQSDVTELQATLEELRQSAPRNILSRKGDLVVPYPPMVKFKPSKPMKSVTLKHKVMRMCGFKQVGGYSSLATVNQGGTVILWDATTGLKFETFHVGKGSAMSLAVNTNGTILAAGGLSCFIEIYVIGTQLRELTNTKVKVKVPIKDVDAGKASISGRAPQYRYSLAGHDAAVSAVKFLDETTIVSGGHDNYVFMWDVTIGKPFLSLQELAPVTAVDTTRSMLFATAAQDGTVKVWDARERAGHAEKFYAPAPLNGVRFMPDEKSLLASTRGGLILYDLRCNSTLETYMFRGGSISSMDVSSSGRLGVVGTDSGALFPVDLIQNRWFPSIQKRKDRITGTVIADGTVFASSWDGSVRSYKYVQ